MRRDLEGLPTGEFLFLSVDSEQQPSFFEHRHLLVMVAVIGDDGAFLQEQSPDRHLHSVDHLARDVRIQLLFGYLAPIVKLHCAVIVS